MESRIFPVSRIRTMPVEGNIIAATLVQKLYNSISSCSVLRIQFSSLRSRGQVCVRIPMYLYLNDAKKQILLKMQSMLIIEHNVWISQVRKIAPLQILRLEKKKKRIL